MRPSAHTSTLLYSGRSEVWPLLWTAIFRQAGALAFVAVSLLPISVIWLAAGARVTMRPSRRVVRLVVLAAVVLSAVVFVHTPNAVETRPGTLNMLKSEYHPVRFGLSALSMAILGLGIVSSDVIGVIGGAGKTARDDSTRLSPRSAAGRSTLVAGYVIAAWVGLAAYQVVRLAARHFTFDTALLAVNVGLVGTLAYLVATTPGIAGRVLAGAGATALLGLLAWGGWSLATRWHRGFTSHFDARQGNGVFDALSSLDPSAERIGVCDYRYYPFFGSRRQFSVCRPLWLPDESSFLQYLHARRCTLVAVNPSGPDTQDRYLGAPLWTEADERLFVPLTATSRYRVFRIDRERLKAKLIWMEDDRRHDGS